MFANLMRPICREIRIAPRHFEKMAGRPSGPLKSPCATRSLRSSRIRSDREGRKACRDTLTKGIPMYSHKNKTPSTGEALGADETVKATNLNGNDTQPASKLLAEANRVIATFPSFITRKSKHQAESRVLRLFLAALGASRQEREV
jgi:hypothetical protein